MNISIRGRMKRAKEFKTIKAAQNFLEEQYSEYVESLDRTTLRNISGIQSTSRYDNRFNDKDVVDAIRNSIDKFPGIPEDIIVYRAGTIKEENRTFVSGSFIKSIVLNQFTEDKKEENLHKILLTKGSKIIPLYPINRLANINDVEMELILDTRRLKKHLFFYEYK